METGPVDSPYREVKEHEFNEGRDFHLTLDKLKIGIECIVRRRTYIDMMRVKRAGTEGGYYAFEVDADISRVDFPTKADLQPEDRKIFVNIFDKRGTRVQGAELIVDEKGFIIENNVGDLRDKEEPEGWHEMGYLLAVQPDPIAAGSRLAFARNMSKAQGLLQEPIIETEVA